MSRGVTEEGIVKERGRAGNKGLQRRERITKEVREYMSAGKRKLLRQEKDIEIGRYTSRNEEFRKANLKKMRGE